MLCRTQPVHKVTHLSQLLYPCMSFILVYSMNDLLLVAFLFLCFINVDSLFAYGIAKAKSKKELAHEGNSSFLWRIQTNPTSYLFGIIQVPLVQVLDAIPNNMMEAFNGSQKFYSELDMDTPGATAELSSCKRLPKNHSISQILPWETYVRLNSYVNYLKTKISSWLIEGQNTERLSADDISNMIFANWERKRLAWIWLSIDLVTKSYITSMEYPSLDEYLHELAKQQGKFVGAVEKVKDQCNLVNNMNTSHVLFFINKTLEAKNDEILSISTRQMEQMILDYRNGIVPPASLFVDTAYYHQYLVDISAKTNRSNEIDNKRSQQIIKELTSYMRKYALVERNKKMAKQILSLTSDEPETSFFFAFGVSHFVGKDSVVDMLRRKGLQIERVSPEAQLVFEDYNSFSGKTNLYYVDVVFLFFYAIIILLIIIGCYI